MKRFIATTSLLTLLGLTALLAPMTANANCSERKTAGTVIGGVGGALLGNQVSHGGAGAVVGGVGGALLGHHVASQHGGCRDRSQAAYDNRGRHGYDQSRHHHNRYAHNHSGDYDQYGRPY